MIPNIIHQTWKSKTELPDNFLAWRNSFIELNPNFTINLHDDLDNRNLLIKHLPQLLSVYDNFPREIFRVDFIRAIYLFFYGGIYADMDVQCLKSLDRYLSLSGVYLAKMGEQEDFPHSIPNAMMASSKGCGFWLFYILKMVELSYTPYTENSPEYITGPVVLKNCALEFNSNIEKCKQVITEFINQHEIPLDVLIMDFSLVNIMEPNVWFPLNWNDDEHLEIRKKVLSNELFPNRHEALILFPGSEAITYWTHTWGEI
jgi:mannosyltransferase OCH1-like enzyme